VSTVIGTLLGRLRRLSAARSVDARIARAAVVSGGLSAGVKGAAFAKEILVAAIFGVSQQLDAYLIALMLVGVPQGIIVNAVQWTLVPEFVNVELNRGRAPARLLLRQVISLALIAQLGLLVLGAALLPWLLPHLTAAFDDQGLVALRNGLLLLGLYYFASGPLLIGYAILQARHRFVANGAIPVITPVVIVVLLVLHPAAIAETLALGMALGFVAELIVVQWMLTKEGLTLAPTRGPFDLIGRPFLRSVAKLSAATTALSLLLLVEQAAAARIGVGAVSTLGYAFKLPALVAALAVVAIWTAVFPYFTEMLVRGQIEQCRATLRRCAVWVCASGTALAAILIVSSEPIVRLFFLRGAFSERDAAAVTLAQQAYLVQLPGALLLALSLRLLLARGRSELVLATYASQLALFVAAIMVGLAYARSPAVIALASSFAVTIAAALAFLMADRSVRVS
jgi:putative peptidoglycan lipid II flippase